MNKKSKLVLFFIVGLLVINFSLPVEAASFSDLGLGGEINGLIEADLDGDLMEELIVTTSLEGYVYVFKLKEKNEYVLADAKFIGSWVNQPRVGRLVKNRLPKLVAVNNLNQLIVLEFDGKELKLVGSSTPYEEEIKRIAIGDLNGDNLDEVVIGFEQSLLVLELTPDGFVAVCEEERYDQVIIDILINQGNIIVAFSEELLFLSLEDGALERVELSDGFLYQEEPILSVSKSIKWGDIFPAEELLTRGEGIALISLAYKLQPQINGNYFTDLPANFYLAGLINAAYEKGLVSGYPDGRIRPDRPLSRQEYLVILCRAAGIEPSNLVGDLPYSDWDSCGDWAKSYLRAAWDKGIIDGKDVLLRPQAQISWGEANNWLLKTLKKQ